MVSSEGLNKSIAALLTLEGAGFIKHPDGSHSALWQGAKLGLGDIVVTSPGSKAVIVLADGSEFEFGKAQGDAVKIDASVLDIVSDISEVRVLDLSYLYPLLNDNQLDRPTVHLDESVANLVVADGNDSGEIRDLLDSNPAPAFSGDLGGGDLTSGNRYVVLESNPIAYDTNPFPTNSAPELSSESYNQSAAFLDHHSAGPENTPLALLMQNFSAVTPTELPPLNISLALDSGLANNLPSINDDLPVIYHVTLDHAVESILVLNPVLVWTNENGGTGTIDLKPINIGVGELSGDVQVILPEESDNSVVSYKLYLTMNIFDVDGINVLSDEPPHVDGTMVVASNDELTLASDYDTEHMESTVSINWQTYDFDPPLSLDDEGNNPTISVTVTDPEILQHVDKSPILFDVWAVSLDLPDPILIAHLSTASAESFNSSTFVDGIDVILSNDSNGLDTLYFDGIPTDFGEGYEGLSFKLVVTASGFLPSQEMPLNYLSSHETTSWAGASMDLPVFTEHVQNELSFHLDSPSVDDYGYISEIDATQIQINVHFSGDLASALTFNLKLGDAIVDSLTFDPQVTDLSAPVFYDATQYEPIFQQYGTYSFNYSLPDSEDGLPFSFSLELAPGQDLESAGYEEMAPNLETLDFTIHPDVNVTMDALEVDDESGATAWIHIDHALTDNLVLEAKVYLDADGVTTLFDTVPITILAGEKDALLTIPLNEETEGLNFKLSLEYNDITPLLFDGNIESNLSSEYVTVDVSQVTEIPFTVYSDTVHINVSTDVTLINDEDLSATVDFKYTIDLPFDYSVNSSISFDAQIGNVGGVGSAILPNILTIDGSSLLWDEQNQNWFGHFSIQATLLPDGIHNLTLLPIDNHDHTAAFSTFGMDDIVVNPTSEFNVVDYSVELIDGINTYIYSDIDTSEVDNQSCDVLHGADLIEGFGIEDSALQFVDAYLGKTEFFSSENTPVESSMINHLSINDGLVTFFSNNGEVSINQDNLSQAVDFLIQHTLGTTGLTVDFLVNNGSGFDTYVFNQGATQSGSSVPSYTLVNLSNTEAAGLSLGSPSVELIHIEQG